MGKIHTYPSTNKVFIEDVSVAVHIATFGLVKGYYDAAKLLKSKPAEIDAACLAPGGKGAKVNGKTVRLAKLVEVQEAFPEYKPIKHSPHSKPTIAVPTAVIVKVGAKKHKIFHRSMTSARMAWELSVTQFEMIAEKRPGWREIRPGCVWDIKTHVNVPSDAEFSVGNAVGTLFKLSLHKSGSVGIKYIGPSTLPDVPSVPMAILNNAN